MRILYSVLAMAAASLTAVATAPSETTSVMRYDRSNPSFSSVPMTSWSNGVTTVPEGNNIVKSGMLRTVKGTKATIQTIGIIENTNAAPISKISRAEDEEKPAVEVVFNFIIPEGATVDDPFVVMQGETFMDDGMAFPIGDDYTIDQPLPCLWETYVGHYQVLAKASYYLEDGYPSGYLWYGEIDVTEDGDNTFTVDFTQCSVGIGIDAEMSNGQPWPWAGDDEIGCVFSNKISFDTPCGRSLGVSVSGWGVGKYNFLATDNLPEDAAYEQNQKLVDNDTMEGDLLIQYFRGPFNETKILEIKAADYSPFNCDFCLTEDEIANQVRGSVVGYGFTVKVGDGWSNSFTAASSTQTAPAEPISSIHMNVCTARYSDEGEFPYFFGTVLTRRNSEEGIDALQKWSGWMVNYSDGVPYLGMPDAYFTVRDEDRKLIRLTYLSAWDEFRIAPTTQPNYSNFFNPVYLNAMVMPFPDTSDPTLPVVDAYAGGNFLGTFYERVDFSENPFNYLKAVRYNGEDVDGMNGIMGKPLLGAKFEFDLVAPSFVENSFMSTTELTEGLDIAAGMEGLADFIAPQMRNYQVRSSEGIIGIWQPKDDTETSILANVCDFDTQGAEKLIASAKIEIAQQDADEWTELTTTVENPEYICFGNKIEAKFNGSELCQPDTWYRIRITAYDDMGNFASWTMNNAFKYTDKASAPSITVSEADVVSTILYDLNGRRVVNPKAGLYIKADRLADGTVRYSKIAL